MASKLLVVQLVLYHTGSQNESLQLHCLHNFIYGSDEIKTFQNLSLQLQNQVTRILIERTAEAPGGRMKRCVETM